MNSSEIFNYLMEKYDIENIPYVILHSYQKLPKQFDSDIDIAIDAKDIMSAVHQLDSFILPTGWRIIQYWRHENYACDCVISNDKEFLQVDFCIHYERNGRVVLPVDELIADRKKYLNFYVPCAETEFTYILLKKILKKNFSDGSKEQLQNLIGEMGHKGQEKVAKSLMRFLSEEQIEQILINIQQGQYDDIFLDELHDVLLKKTSKFSSNLHYKFFDVKRKIERIIHPTGLFIVLMGVDGAGKTTISNELKERSKVSFRRINHYHSRVRVLKDLSQVRSGETVVDVSDPHGNKKKSGKFVSFLKFNYYFLDYLIGNVMISKEKIQSSLVLIERYYYDYSIDKIRYNLNLSDSFIKFFGHFVKKPDAIYILTGDSRILCERKHEITIEEIDKQKQRLENHFINNKKAIFIDTTNHSIEECVNIMLERNNDIMRGRRKW